MTTYASFKPSVQFLEAGEKGQQFANAANTFKPFLPQEARQSIEGIDKVSQAFTATGRALEHFGFDEAEPEAADSLQPRYQYLLENIFNMPEIAISMEVTPPTVVFKDGQPVKAAPLNGTDQVMGALAFDQADQDSITASGQTIDTDAFTISDSAANDPLTGGGQMMDTDDELGAIFIAPAIGAAIATGAKTAAAAAAAKAAAAAAAAKGVIAGVKAVTAKQIGTAIVTGGVSGVASYGASRFTELLSEADDRDSDYGTPWVPEVAVDPIA